VNEFVRRGYAVAVVGGAQECLYAQHILAGVSTDLRSSVAMFVGKTSISGTGIIMKRSVCCLGFDSGMMHLAVVLGVPTVALFGPTNMMKWAARGDLHRVLCANISCSPCAQFGYTRYCLDNRCMKLLDARTIIGAVAAIVERGGTQNAAR
jgi:ADP-heptose:LPS heptosyltransferase